jgi:anti-anti-sigma factor
MDEHGHLVTASGELDFSNAQRLQDAVSGIELNGHRTVVLDLTDLTFCDVKGVFTLLSASRAVAANGGRVTVRGVSGLPRRVFALTGVDTVVELE